MSDSRLVGLVVGAVLVVAILLGAIYFFRKAPPTEPKPPAEQSQQAPETPKAEGEAAPGGEAESSKPAAQVPSFDVVRIEGTGEGVIAGRATPGWTVQVESDGNAIAETKADAEGAWTVVLDKPLAAGAHSLSLKAISPDGTSSLTAQQPVNVAIGEGPAVAEKPAETAKEEAAPPSEMAAAEPAAKPEEPAAGGAEQPSAKPRPVVFKDVEYSDTGPDAGKLSISGEGDPGASVLLYFDDEPLGQVTVGPDGTWTFETETKLGAGDHMLRADRVEAGTGVVIGRAAIGMRRTEEAASASSQPQPVYPDGPPPEAASPAPSTEMAAAEPPSLASQPQPVYPEAPGEAETPPSEPAAVATAESPVPGQPGTVYPDGPPEPAAAPSIPPAADASTELPSVASQPQPVYPAEVAAAEPTPAPAPEPSPPEPTTPAVTAERPGEATRAHTQPMIVFKSVDYQDSGAESGKVALSGTADPGARIMLFFDNAPLGEVTVGSDGNWSFAAEKKLEVGEHVFRADRVEEGTGIVIGRASIGMARMKPAPKEEEVAAQEPSPSAPRAAAPEAQPGEQVAATEEAKPAPVARKKAQRHRPRLYTVRRGDTLWEIAESYYGGGWHYRAIVRDNRRKIKNPHWIYPKQKFSMPRRG